MSWSHFQKEGKQAKIAFFFANHTRLSFPFFFVSLEPHVERPEESLKIANIYIMTTPQIRIINKVHIIEYFI